MRQAPDAKIVQALAAESHHGRILVWQFDNPIQSSVRRIAMQASAARNCTPMATVLIKRAAVRNFQFAGYFSKDPFPAKLGVMPSLS